MCLSILDYYLKIIYAWSNLLGKGAIIPKNASWMPLSASLGTVKTVYP